ncbi:MAG: hypothetical protein DDT35_00270 [Firmicutes bacterium]|nr:hypothetical protein [Bacillota bacterium]
MLEFKVLTIKDRAWVQPLLVKNGAMGNDAAFGTLYIWSDVYHHSACLHEGTLFSLYGGESNIYGVPVGGDLPWALGVLMADARAKGHRFRLWGLTREQMAEVEQVMPDTFKYRLNRDGSDYIYHAADLATLAGRKFHDKRNHVNRFRRTYSYEYEDITAANLPEIAVMADEWRRANHGKGDEDLKREGCALDTSLAQFNELGFSGGLIRIDGAVVAFTLGEEINSEVYLVHFEKAQSEFGGLYAAINHEFASRHLGKYRFINREEDLGIEGLRKAKMSYNPAFILEKYVASLKGETFGG